MNIQYIGLGTGKLQNNGVTADFNHDYNTVRAGLDYHAGQVYGLMKYQIPIWSWERR